MHILLQHFTCSRASNVFQHVNGLLIAFISEVWISEDPALDWYIYPFWVECIDVIRKISCLKLDYDLVQIFQSTTPLLSSKCHTAISPHPSPILYDVTRAQMPCPLSLAFLDSPAYNPVQQCIQLSIRKLK